MFYNVTYHRMLHFGSSKHSSNLWGFGLSSKKTKGQINDILFSVGFFYSITFTTFFVYCTWQLGRGAGSKKKREHRHAAVAHLEIASSHANLIPVFRFSMLVIFS